MQDINSKVNDGGATAAGQASANEWNQFSLELQNFIISTDQSLNGGILTQIGQGVASHATNGDFTIDSGTPDVYVLTPEGNNDAAPNYKDGMRLRFIAGNTNTLTTATVNYAGKGVKNLVNLAVGSLSTTEDNNIVFRSGSDDFILKTTGVGAGSIGQSEIDTSELNPIVQIVRNEDATVAAGTATMPFDNSIPQQTEGQEFTPIATTITPKDASNLLKVRVGMQMSGRTAVSILSIALFQDAVANAIKSSAFTFTVADEQFYMYMEFEVVAGSTAARTFKVRHGTANGSNSTVNGDNGSARGGATLATFMEVTEVVQ